MLREMLDSHPNISCGPETQFLQDMREIERRHWDRLSGFDLSQSQWRLSVAKLFADIHEGFARAKGKDRWADKSPNYALILDYIDSLFPTCQVIHIIRNGRDVVSSYRKRWGVAQARHAGRAWRCHIEAARGSVLATDQHRYKEVRYERLVRDPEQTMRDLLVFLREPWADSVLQFGQFARPGAGIRSPEPARRADALNGEASVVYATSVGKALELRDVEPRLRLWLTAGSLMRELGYQ